MKRRLQQLLDTNTRALDKVTGPNWSMLYGAIIAIVLLYLTGQLT